MVRDFTYIDDIISGLISSIEKNYSCEIFNLGNNRTVDLLDLVSIIEKKIGYKAKVKYEPMQLGDVKETFADIKHAKNKLGYLPLTNVNDGVDKFLNWYIKYLKR